MLTADELVRLAAETVDPADWGGALCIAFEARRLAAAQVCWLNQRWFLEHGVDITDSATERRANAWLLERFAYVIPRPDDPAEAFTSGSAQFLADRYGDTSLVPNGGSGRAGIRDGFQVKGIGVTPLVGEAAGWLHSHGCVWLEEAIRETIFAELFAAESPVGAIPTVAILDTGLRAHHDGVAGERRALVVRPFVPRPAHLQRAPSFVPVGGDPEAQPLDARRTREAIEAYWRNAGGRAAAVPTELFHRLGRQVAFSQIQRLSHGGFFSSNLTLRGELIDFGAATAWPDWSRHCPSLNAPFFGDEETNIAQMAYSLAFYFGKYGGDDTGSAATMLAAFRAGYAAGTIDEAARIWALDRSDSAAVTIATVLVAAFVRQQHHGTRTANAHTPVALTADEYRLIDAALDAAPSRRLRAWRCAMRFLQPRSNVERQRLQAWLFTELVHCDRSQPLSANAVNAAVAQSLSAARRGWNDLPANLHVHAQVTDGCSSALACRHDSDGTSWVWLQGLRLGDRVLLFGQWHCYTDLMAYRVANNARRWTGVVPGIATAGAESQLLIGETTIQVPVMVPLAAPSDPAQEA